MAEIARNGLTSQRSVSRTTSLVDQQVPGDSGILGSYALGFTLIFFGFRSLGAGINETPAVSVITAILGGGVSMLAGLLDFFRGSSSNATMTFLFGVYWLLLAVLDWPGWSVIDHYNTPQEYNNTLGVLHLLYAVICFVHLTSLLRTTVAQVTMIPAPRPLQILLMGFATTNFVVLACVYFTANVVVTRVAGVLSLIVGSLAIYIGAAFHSKVLHLGRIHSKNGLEDFQKVA